MPDYLLINGLQLRYYYVGDGLIVTRMGEGTWMVYHLGTLLPVLRHPFYRKCDAVKAAQAVRDLYPSIGKANPGKEIVSHEKKVREIFTMSGCKEIPISISLNLRGTKTMYSSLAKEQQDLL